MIQKPRLLDLFCGAGGIAQGFMKAGFHVTGVDIEPQPNYPGDEFYQDDALHFLDTHDLSIYAHHHASPVCKGFSLASEFHPGTKAKYTNLLPAIRERFIKSGKPYTIENVSGAPLIKAIMLCGTMFDLNVIRHRYFESNILLFQPEHYPHPRKAGRPGAIPTPGEYWCVGGHFGKKYEAAAAMGITWMHTQAEISQAIPPAYTKYIGEQLLAVMEVAA